jgi:hypothetical protein
MLLIKLQTLLMLSFTFELFTEISSPISVLSATSSKRWKSTDEPVRGMESFRNKEKNDSFIISFGETDTFTYLVLISLLVSQGWTVFFIAIKQSSLL